jgi:hypothetical protein
MTTPGQPPSRVEYAVRGGGLLLGSMGLGALCCYLAGLSDSLSDSRSRLILGLILGALASPAFIYAMWHPPRAKKGFLIVLVNALAAFVIGQGLGMGGAFIISGPAFVMICLSFGESGKTAALEHARARNCCPACGYSLAGLESRVCPECGRGTV